MDPEELAVRIRIEKVRLAWEFNSREVEVHRQRLLQLFVLFVTLAFTTFASVVGDKVPLIPGTGFGVLMLLGAAYAQLQMGRLPRRLRRSLEVGMEGLDMLMTKEK